MDGQGFHLFMFEDTGIALGEDDDAIAANIVML